MLRRVLLGLLKGGLIGALLGALVLFGLGITTLSGWAGYLAAVLGGVTVALIAGKPIWEKGAWVEVLLKSVAGALGGAGLFYVIDRYFGASGDAAGGSALAGQPLLVLPLVATILAMLFEADNTGDDQESPSPSKKQRVESLAAEPLESDAEEPAPGETQARRRSTRAGS